MGIAEVAAHLVANAYLTTIMYPITRASQQPAERFPTDAEIEGLFSPDDDPEPLQPLPQQQQPPQAASSSSAAPPPAARQEGERQQLPTDRDDAQPDEPAEPDDDWTNYDLGRSLAILRDGTEAARRRALTRLHRKLWHASSARMNDILSVAGVPESALNLIQQVVDNCHVCRLWQKPGKRSIALGRLTTNFNEVVQTDLLFINKWIILHLVDEATRWSMTKVLRKKDAATLLNAITTTWIQIWGPMRTLVTDEESGLHGDETSTWADRHGVEMK